MFRGRKVFGEVLLLTVGMCVGLDDVVVRFKFQKCPNGVLFVPPAQELQCYAIRLIASVCAPIRFVFSNMHRDMLPYPFTHSRRRSMAASL